MGCFCYDVWYMYDDEDEYEEDDTENDPERLRSDEFNAQRGKDDRAFFDDLAKKEDERHNAMRADMKKRALVLSELDQKLRHKKTELHALEMKIMQEKDAIDFEQKKIYRMTVGMGNGDEASVRAIPILSKDIDKEDDDNGFSVSRAEANIKQMEEEKITLEKTISTMSVTVSEEQRALSQLQHTLLRM